MKELESLLQIFYWAKGINKTNVENDQLAERRPEG